MSFAPMAASSRIDRGDHNLSKTNSFWPFLRVTFSWNDPPVFRIGYFYPQTNERHSETIPMMTIPKVKSPETVM